MYKKTVEIEGRITHIRQCRDWLDFLSIAERTLYGHKDEKINGLSCKSVAIGNKQWHGTDSLEEAVAIAKSGWSRGRKQLLAFSSELSIVELLSKTQRFRQISSVDGDELDMDAFLMGTPEHMWSIQEVITSGRGKVFEFFVNRSVACDIDSVQIIRRGVAILAIIHIMSVLGYAFEISIAMAVQSNDGEMYELFIPILHAGDPLNLDTLAFMFAHPAVIRRLCFAVEEDESLEIRNKFGFSVGRGYGCPIQPKSIPKSAHLIDWEDGLDNDSDEDTLSFVVSYLKKIGIELNSNMF